MKLHLCVFLSVIISAILITACNNEEENKHGLVADSLVCGTWILKSGLVSRHITNSEQFNWNNPDCEEATTIINYLYSDNSGKTLQFSDSLLQYSQVCTTTRPFISVSDSVIPGNEWEAGNTISRSLNFVYKLTFNTDGTYLANISYNAFESNYPLPPDESGNPQWGYIFSGTVDYMDYWNWNDANDPIPGEILLHGFPMPAFTIAAHYQTDKSFDFNNISAVDIINQDLVFQFDTVGTDSVRLGSDYSQDHFNQQQSSYFQAYTPEGNNINCQSTTTFSGSENDDYQNLIFIKEPAK
jgi:hypothetical protein